MSIPCIVFTVIYCITLFLYFFSETSGNMKLRAPNKIALAVMFFTFGLVQFIIQDKFSFMRFDIILILALLFAALGDILLLWSFTKGGVVFLVGNICFFVYELLLLISSGIGISSFWWIFVAIFVLSVTYTLLFLFEVIKGGKYKYPFIAYLISITFHGIAGLAVAIYLPSTHLLLGLGSVLFMISDILLTLHKLVYPDNKWILRANSGFYFAGLLLIVLSMAL